MTSDPVPEIRIDEAHGDGLRQAAFRLRRMAYWPSEASVRGGEGRLFDADDDTGVILTACQGKEVVGTLRMNWMDAGLSAALPPGLQIHRFLKHADTAHVVHLSRLAVAPQPRNESVVLLLMIAAAERGADRQVEVALCDCQPHLLDFYLRVGFRTYAPAFEHNEGGVVIPLVLLGDDLEHLRAVRSPVYPTLERGGRPRPSLNALRDVIENGHDIGIQTRWRDFGRLYADQLAQSRLLAGLDEAERARLLEHGMVLTVMPGQRLIVEAQPTRTLFLVLDGLLEVIRDSRVMGLASAGDVVGEVAALLDIPRTATVTAREPSSALAISDRVVRRILESDPTLGAKLALNLAREIARKRVMAVQGGHE